MPAAISQPPPKSALDLVVRLQRQRRHLGPRNTSGRLLDECVLALTDLAQQLHALGIATRALELEVETLRTRTQAGLGFPERPVVPERTGEPA